MSDWKREGEWYDEIKPGAYGIPQSPPVHHYPPENTKEATRRAREQMAWGRDYIARRYGEEDA